MKLETERLELAPLTGEQLAMLLWNLPELERQLSCKYDGNEIIGPVAQAVEEQYEAIKECENPEDYLFFTFWQIVLKESRTIVGSICLKGLPDEQGQVEIGYGLSHVYEKNGYMTEAVLALSSWLLSKPGVKAMTAETSKYNEASNSVLKRCGMNIAKSAEDQLWWRLAT